MKTKSSGRPTIHQVAFASFIGTAIEWYDFFLYLFAAPIFAALFFPDMKDGLLASIGTFAIGFIARPIGGIVCGHYGDRIGRKSMLVLTLLIIGISTFLIGVLPTFETAGIWAPILLVVLRFVQGFGIGGEWGGAVLMAVEHSSSSKKRGFFGSWAQAGVPIGLFLATVVFLLISIVPNNFMLNGGWRIGFLLSIALLFVGLYIRLEISESPLFKGMKNSKIESKAPIYDVLYKYPKNILLAMGARLVENSAFYVCTIFVLTYNKKNALYSDTSIYLAIAFASLLGFITVPTFGWLSDLFGRKKLYIIGTIFTGLFAFPFFLLLQTGQTYLMILAIVAALSVGHAAMYGPQASFFSELFATEVRYSGASLGYQLASVFGGGIFTYVAVDVFNKTGITWLIALIIIGMSVISTVSVYLATETFNKSLNSAS